MICVLRHQSRWSFPTPRTWTLITMYLTSVVVTAANVRELLGRVPVPEFMPGLREVTARPGGDAILPCSVRHLGTKKVVWRDIRKDQFLTIGKMAWSGNPNVSVNHKKRHDNITEWNLVLKDITREDSGPYECQVTSRVGHQKKVMLRVEGPPITKPDAGLHLSHDSSSSSSARDSDSHNPPVTVCGATDSYGCLISITGKRYVELGQKIALKCNASGGVRVADEIDWFKSGDKIDSEKYSHIIIDKYVSVEYRAFISDLVIDRSSLTDSGDYICRSSRNDIADLKVTVLHGAGSEPNKRGTEQGGRDRQVQSVENAGHSHSSNALSLSLVTSLVLTMYSWHATLCPTQFGLYS